MSFDYVLPMGEDKTWSPGPWTTSLDRVHGLPLWTASMDPLFFIPKKIEKRKKKAGTPRVSHRCCFSTVSTILFHVQ